MRFVVSLWHICLWLQDHSTGQSPSSYTDVWAGLEEYARDRWPAAGEVLYRWSGQVCWVEWGTGPGVACQLLKQICWNTWWLDGV